MDIDTSYTNELSSIIYGRQRASDKGDDDKGDTAPNPYVTGQYSSEKNPKHKIHVIIYNCLPLSTVPERSRDVGAIAVYELADTLKYTIPKNQLNQSILTCTARGLLRRSFLITKIYFQCQVQNERSVSQNADRILSEKIWCKNSPIHHYPRISALLFDMSRWAV